MDLRETVRDIQDFPQKGILFRDITPVLKDPKAFKIALEGMASLTEGVPFDAIAGPESRGFIFGVPLAVNMEKSFIPVRKAGKLPCETVSRAYDLEYGQAVIEFHKDAILPGQRVMIVDDLLATGGTCKTLCEMIESVGGIVAGLVFFIELSALGGRDRLKDYKVFSLLEY